MIAFWRAYLADESGTAIIEYALILSFISMASYATLLAIGDSLQQFFIDTSNGLSGVATDPK